MFTNILLIMLIVLALAIFGELVKIYEKLDASNIREE